MEDLEYQAHGTWPCKIGGGEPLRKNQWEVQAQTCAAGRLF